MTWPKDFCLSGTSPQDITSVQRAGVCGWANCERELSFRFLADAVVHQKRTVTFVVFIRAWITLISSCLGLLLTKHLSKYNTVDKLSCKRSV